MSQLQFLPIICVLILQLFHALASDSSLQTYIVHVDLPKTTQISSYLGLSIDLESWYKSFLPTTLASSAATPRIIYPYHNVFSGFAAKLTSEEVKEMEKKKGFLSARPQQTLSLHTTHTPNFLGLHQQLGFWNQSNYGKGVIIGVLDTGIIPDHPSFNDDGMPPPPAKWKGRCEFNYTGACNNKLIGARYFRDGDGTPFDDDGHGTHTASTAAGNFVRGANVLGSANGTAAGVAPLAHLAVYKVCTARSCSESDVLAAMDAAIDDGVDVLSVSLGGSSKPFHDDFIALGAFGAMERGVFVSASAGNDGPFNFSLSNEAPWILTVGASTIDRKIVATATLGDGQELRGESGFQAIDFPASLMPVVYPGANASDSSARFCSRRSLNDTVKGKIVVCQIGGGTTAVEKGEAVRDAGGAAMILINTRSMGFITSVNAHVLPATNLNYQDGIKILTYINTTSSPTAKIVFNGTVIGDNNSPTVEWFSSRGPNQASPGILKPDIIGPGVNILAAWSTSIENNTNTKQTFNFLSGTSMSCPHLSGVAALLKSAHPDWSPAAIKSAMMTTADTVNLEEKPILDERLLPADVFSTGAGHVTPARANNPGLVYDIEPRDYLPYLCGLNYTDNEMGLILQRRVNCSAESSVVEGQLNYPSFTWRFSSLNQTFTRTVTNVGEANSTYTAEVVAPRGVEVAVEPRQLSFAGLNEKRMYRVRFSRTSDGGNVSVSQGYIMWKSDKYSVRSAIAVF